jgi:LysR family cyn operon transcriptional activator
MPKLRKQKEVEGKDLRYFVVAYEEGNFSRAAEILHTTQSNVSMRIHDLAQSLRAPLFRRRQHGVAPTSQGKALYPHAKRAIEILDRTKRAVRPR